jgi:hypothetical protein
MVYFSYCIFTKSGKLHPLMNGYTTADECSINPTLLLLPPASIIPFLVCEGILVGKDDNWIQHAKCTCSNELSGIQVIII